LVGDDLLDAGDGQARQLGVADRSVVLTKLGNASGGNGPYLKTDATLERGRRLGNLSTPITVQKLQTALHA
jgi:hypothetical protein